MTAGRELVHGAPSTMGDHEQLTTTRMLRDAARSFGEQEISYRDDSGQWQVTDYAAVWDRVQRAGAALEGLGIGPGDRVGLLLWNSLQHFESYFSIPLVGATMIQLNMRLAPADLSYVIQHSRASTIIVDHTLLPLAQAVREHVPEVTRWIVVGPDGAGQDWEDFDGVLSYEQLIEQSQPLEQAPDMAETTASGACYTTGTTGRPKGVFFSHRSVWLHASAVCLNIGLTAEDRVMMLTPMFHVQCWGLPYSATLVGAQIVLPGRFTLEDMDLLTEAIVEQSVTVAPAAPAILMPMLRSLRRRETMPRLDGMRFLCGATEPPVSMMRAFHDLTGAEVVHAYGATETSPVVSLNRMKPALAARLSEDEAWEMRRFQGLIVAGVEIRILDPMGEPVPADGRTAGEVRLRGPWITASYAENPEATAAAFDDDGFWLSGDIGCLDEHGYLKITDRLKDVIKSGGEWISSIDMENQLVALDGVVEATVIGVPHPQWQERPLALVVRAEGSDLTEESVRAHLGRTFASWQLPDEIRFIEEIARTGVGKINKRQLREEYEDAYAEAAPDA